MTLQRGRNLYFDFHVTLEQLQNALGQPSRRTTFRYLRQVRYLRSYNHNGRFYTARDPARFDRFGLFSLGAVHFSRDGSLATTVQRLVEDSPDGCTDKQLRALLHVPVHPFLLAAVRQGRARRERVGGVYVYLSAAPQTGAEQLRARQASRAASRSSELAAAFQPDVIIEVLLVLVRHPRSLPAEVARRLQGHSPPIRLAQVQAVFDRFGLAGIGDVLVVIDQVNIVNIAFFEAKGDAPVTGNRNAPILFQTAFQSVQPITGHVKVFGSACTIQVRQRKGDSPNLIGPHFACISSCVQALQPTVSEFSNHAGVYRGTVHISSDSLVQ